ncbi:PH domain-containing protein [Ectobacillus ponti]|uniref:PH domain-containing protein n=1 Tax=Ectobacillus ponti TaxID=2961894 RepID=A0AA41X3N9_9BACI|nr:PH domain-containing protein [Ectobacillus ponti]MCP8968152.1 PH domain-containing protein [Ectobacillus ponti]
MRSRLEHYIDERAVRVWRLTALVGNGFAVLLYAAVAWGISSLRSLMWLHAVCLGSLMLLAFFTVIVLPKLRWQRWRYVIYEEEIDLQHGVVITTKTLIPMVRVQHVDVRQGPFLRRYGLASVEITTAATKHEIPAVAYEEAEQLRMQLSKLARAATEDV